MIITSKNVWIDNQFQHKSIWIENNRIENITDPISESKDYDDLWVLPGFIDTHNHGFNGVEANYLSKQGFIDWCNQCLKEGITTLLPTFLSETDPSYENGLKKYKEIMDSIELPIRSLGLNLEGPFLSYKRKGIFNPSSFKEISFELFNYYQKLSGNAVKMMTLAPELEGSCQFIQEVTKQGVVISLGHSDATYQQAKDAIEAGASCFTHLYNAMSGLHHRKPGMVGACLDTKEVYAELITDGHHVSDAAIRIASQLKGNDYLITCTDPTGMKGLPAGLYPRKDINATVEVTQEGLAITTEGTIAGSVAKMNELLERNLYYYKMPLIQTINSATINPARMLKIDNDLGSLSNGKLADIVICDDHFNIKAVYVEGHLKEL